MRAVFSVLGLVIVMAVVGFLAKSQIKSLSTPKLDLNAGAASSPASSVPPTKQGATVTEQSQQIQQQYKQAIEAAMQPARAMPDDK